MQLPGCDRHIVSTSGGRTHGPATWRKSQQTPQYKFNCFNYRGPKTITAHHSCAYFGTSLGSRTYWRAPPWRHLFAFSCHQGSPFGLYYKGYTKLYMHLGFLGLEHWNIGTLRSRLRKKNTQWTRTDAADVPIDPAVMGISTDPADASGCVELKESLLKLLLDSSNILIILIYLDISWFSMIVALQSTTTSNEEHFFRRQGKIVLWLANFSVLGKEWDPCTGTGWSKLSGLDAVFFFQKVDPTTPGPRQGRITVVEEDTHKQR